MNGKPIILMQDKRPCCVAPGPHIIWGTTIMSIFPVPNMIDAQAQAFPVLTEAQIKRIRPGGKLRRVEPGEVLFAPGDTLVPFFVLLSGSMEIVQPGPTGERQLVTHHPGGFTGEFNMISEQHAMAKGRVLEGVNSWSSRAMACARW